MVELITLFSLVLIILFFRCSLLLGSTLILSSLVFFTIWELSSWFFIIFSWLIFATPILCLQCKNWRKNSLTKPILSFFQKIGPKLSKTEQEALEAGNTWWEQELFCGKPNWAFFNQIQYPKLTSAEQEFLAGPTVELCRLINDWDITHNRLDLPDEMWTFMKEKGFFGLCIPTEYGGKGFSPFLHSELVSIIGPLSCTVASTVTVPNSLGPGELLLNYGTREQKNYYLPRLATGIDIPCFALTGIESGSDAANMKDVGYVCYHKIDGQEVLGFRLTINKRYITLAPVATLIGVAFRLYDPERLLGETEELGITCALIKRETTGLKIGKRHFPLNIPFQNGPIAADNIFLPLSSIIGGRDMVGQGWRMLMQCLAEGRSISLPSISAGSARMAAAATGGYSRIRRQFNSSLSQFQGVQSLLGRMGALSYALDATRKLAATSVSQGQRSAVLAAIVKYHITELARSVFAEDAMDIHAGKGICMGPKNYLARNYQAAPIAITVEGSNILTRNLMIFGQGAIRCHPYALLEIKAASLTDPEERLRQFDEALFGHIAYVASNLVRSIVLSFTRGYVLAKKVKDPTARYYQLVETYSSCLALWADIAMASLGASLKKHENICARLGDIHSMLLLVTATLKRYQMEGRPREDLPFVHWSCQLFLHRLEQSLQELITNYPFRGISWLAKIATLPFGSCLTPPSDVLTCEVANLLSSPGAARDRLLGNSFLEPTEFNPMGILENVLHDVVAAEPYEKKLREAIKSGNLSDRHDYLTLIEQAVEQSLITRDQADLVIKANQGRLEIIAVDAFEAEELLLKGQNFPD